MNKDELDTTEAPEVALTYCILPSEHIVKLKFILESYEGLGLVRTLNAARGEIVILSTTDTVDEARKVVESLQADIPVQIVNEPPSDMSGDWLLGDMEV